MPLYVYEKENGERVERLFSISEAPDSIVCEDGQVAKKTFGLPYLPGSLNSKIKKEQTQKNVEAGERGRSYWTEKLKGK